MLANQHAAASPASCRACSLTSSPASNSRAGELTPRIIDETSMILFKIFFIYIFLYLATIGIIPNFTVPGRLFEIFSKHLCRLEENILLLFGWDGGRKDDMHAFLSAVPRDSAPTPQSRRLDSSPQAGEQGTVNR